MPLEGLRVVSLADHPHLVSAVGELRWREWGEYGDDLDGWIRVTAGEANRGRLPITLVALGPGSVVCGAVALGLTDDALTEQERADREPWLLGLVVDPAHRLQQVGRLLVSALEALAATHGHRQVWVATGERAEGFYRRCGWAQVEVRCLASTCETATILGKKL